jgi:predicted RNase H-like nuclease (RuvC/YqgF family)
MSKIEKLLTDLRTKSDDYDRVNDEKKRLVDDLNRQLEEFKKRFSDQVGGKESVINDLNNELNALKSKVVSPLS